MRKHFAQIIQVWGGKEATHRIITETIDEQGNIIDRSETDTTIYTIIGPPSFDEKQHPPGSLQSGTLCLYYWYAGTDADILVSKQINQNSERHDQIVFQGNTYKVDNLDEIAYDLASDGLSHESIFAKYKLTKIAPS
jgi:hypothetical protein